MAIIIIGRARISGLGSLTGVVLVMMLVKWFAHQFCSPRERPTGAESDYDDEDASLS